ncbi:MAG: antitoxin [Beijerinckiaceae bacterium]|nr:antitoxin [Beijerinckiaceae bacterium]
MYKAKLRAVGGSVMFAIPKPLLDSLGLRANQQVGVSMSDGRMIVEPKVRVRYTLAELMAQCDLDEPVPAEDREWLDAPPAGREAI